MNRTKRVTKDIHHNKFADPNNGQILYKDSVRLRNTHAKKQ